MSVMSFDNVKMILKNVRFCDIIKVQSRGKPQENKLKQNRRFKNDKLPY